MGTPDSSWLAVPRLSLLPRGTRIIHLVRDPILVVRSLLHAGFPTPAPHDLYSQFVGRHRPDITASPELLDRVLAYVSRWDEPVEVYRPWVLRVEDATPDIVANAVEFVSGRRPARARVAWVLRRLGTRVNAHCPPSVASPPWSEVLQRSGGVELADRAEWYGYPT